MYETFFSKPILKFAILWVCGLFASDFGFCSSLPGLYASLAEVLLDILAALEEE